MSKRRMSFDKEDASNSRERKLPRRNPNHQEAPIPANPIPAQDLLFEKTLTFSEATSNQLKITGAHKATLMAFLTDAEREILAENGGLMVGTRIANANANGNGVEYELELKRNSMTYFNGWGPVARANQFDTGDSVQGFGYRANGKFRLNLNIIRNRNRNNRVAPIPANPNPAAPIPAQGLLFEKKLSATDATRDQLVITGAHRATLVAFLRDEERNLVEGIGVGLLIRTTGGNGVEYILELKKTKKMLYFNRWQVVAASHQLNIGDSVQGFGYRAAGEFRLHLNFIK
ncbi:hypothetical protein SASPL_102791 [Salvia splendens]|uniref:Uncharacterized protein n=1 Tax=Salvia splendens TaxID=180675 RepID=A0A8X9AE41_SALSN|nr:hypothetical protein SASPL_102791 [Salvia splendens]